MKPKKPPRERKRIHIGQHYVEIVPIENGLPYVKAQVNHPPTPGEQEAIETIMNDPSPYI